MPEANVRAVDIYPYRLSAAAPEFLLMRRAEGLAYAGQWRMVGGKIEPGETAWRAALRELREETGHTPEAFWALPSANVFYEWQRDQVNLIPAFAWLRAEAAVQRLLWPEQQRLLRMADRMLREGGIPPELIVRS